MGINIEQIKNHQAGIIGSKQIFKAAVIIPLIKTTEGYELLFEVRSNRLNKQPGDICFPGGKVEAGESPKEAAIRELCEELMIDQSQFIYLGENDLFHSETMMIYPYIGILQDYQYTYNEEVDHVFTVPLSFLEQKQIERHTVDYQPIFQDDFPFDKIVGGKNYQWRNRKVTQYFYQYNDYCIWGLTARIIHNFINTFFAYD